MHAQSGDILNKTIEAPDFNGTKKEFLKLLELKIGITFSYTSGLNLNEKITISKRKSSLKDFLDILFPGHTVDYQVSGAKILLIVKKNMAQNIRGIIIDSESGQTIPGVNIQIVDSNPLLGTVSDEKGEFVLHGIPVGRYTLKASFIGYETVTIPDVLVGSAREISLEIKLSEIAYKLDEIMVRPKTAKGTPLNEMATVSSRSFSLEEGKKYPATIDDPGRMALVYAGVSSADDASNEIVVRGNSPNGLMWRIEGVEVPSPNHFYEEGVSAGFVSMLSANMVSKSDFYTGAFPAEYGNASSGVFDIYLRHGNTRVREYSFQAGLLGTDFTLEGPFSKKYTGSYLVNYRYSTFGLIEKLGFKLRQSLIPQFQDLSFKFFFPANRAGTFSLWGLGGKGDATVNAISEPSEWQNWDDRTTDVSITNMGVMGLNHILPFAGNSFLKTSVSLSGLKTINDIWYYDNELNYIHDFGGKKINWSTKISSTLNTKFSSRLSLKTGLIYTFYDFDYFEKSYYLNTEFINNKENSYYFQAFIQSKLKLTNRFAITPGVHYFYLGLNQNNSVEPRIGLSYSMDKNKTLALGFGMHCRMELLSTYLAKINVNGFYNEPNKYLDLSKALHYVISYDHYFNDDFHAKIEAYYQHLYRIPVLNKSPYAITPLNNENVYDTLVNKGYGRNVGIELTLEKFFTGGYFFLATGSVYDSKVKYLDNTWYNSRFNGNFITNIVGGKEFKIGVRNSNFININGKLIWAGGRRATPIKSYQFNDLQDFALDYSKSYQRQSENYFRLDVGISYRMNQLRTAHILSIDIQNVTDRKNVLSMEYSLNSKPAGGYYVTDNMTYQLGIIPVIKYRIEF
jgi:hypothetical protein